MKVLDAGLDLSKLGSDDGLKVYLNGRVILSNNVGRAGSIRKRQLALKKGKTTFSQDSQWRARRVYYKSESESSLWASSPSCDLKRGFLS